MFKELYGGKTFAGELSVFGVRDWDTYYRERAEALGIENNKEPTYHVSLEGTLEKDLKEREMLGGLETYNFRDGAEVRTSYLVGMQYDQEEGVMIALTRNSAYAMVGLMVEKVVESHPRLSEMWNDAVDKNEEKLNVID